MSLSSLSPLLRWEFHIVLHPNIDHVSGSSNKSSTCTGSCCHQKTLEEGDLLTVRSDPLLGDVVDGKPRGGVGQLPQQRG